MFRTFIERSKAYITDPYKESTIDFTNCGPL